MRFRSTPTLEPIARSPRSFWLQRGRGASSPWRPHPQRSAPVHSIARSRVRSSVSAVLTPGRPGYGGVPLGTERPLITLRAKVDQGVVFFIALAPLAGWVSASASGLCAY